MVLDFQRLRHALEALVNIRNAVVALDALRYAETAHHVVYEASGRLFAG